MHSLLKRGLKVVEDGVLLKILQSEIRHEISHPRFQIHFVLLVSRQGKVRLTKWYSPYTQKERSKVIRELSGVILNRGPKLCNFIEWRGYKVVYKRQLDFTLRDALKQYLISKGISESLTNFLLCHLNKKEQDQYVNWLRKLESIMSHSPKP